MGRAAAIVVGLFGMLAAAIFAFYAATPWADHALPVTHSRIGDCILYSSLTIAALAASIGIFRQKVWAWWTALFVSLSLLAFGGWMLWGIGHPETEVQSTEFGAVFGFCVILMSPALIALILLMLGSTRGQFFRQTD